MVGLVGGESAGGEAEPCSIRGESGLPKRGEFGLRREFHLEEGDPGEGGSFGLLRDLVEGFGGLEAREVPMLARMEGVLLRDDLEVVIRLITASLV
mmetsp:Transcript_22668/g.56750  ORF Transcript_22668/g.56750 Transcript_22668/m.56750 type:complete len:96 (+) Transcript_22668:32-319(+)